MKLEFFVPSPRYGARGIRPLYGMNEIIEANRKGRQAGASHKLKEERRVMDIVWVAMRQQKWTMPRKRVHIDLVWHESSNRRDYDNITAYQKYLFDALVKAGAIKDDSQAYIANFPTEKIVIDKRNPGVHVTITEVEDDE